MVADTATYLDAIEHIPPGGMLVLRQVPWQEYEELLRDLSPRPGVRITYDRGRLQAVAPSSDHELYAQVLTDLADAVADHSDILLEPRGSTTWKSKVQARGVEPDGCFWIANAHRILGKARLDPESDPPPDVVVEIDMSSDSLDKFPICALFGVPEIWRYDGTAAQILILSDLGSYVEARASGALPAVTRDVMERFLRMSVTEGRTAVRRACRAWASDLR